MILMILMKNGMKMTDYKINNDLDEIEEFFETSVNPQHFDYILSDSLATVAELGFTITEIQRYIQEKGLENDSKINLQDVSMFKQLVTNIEHDYIRLADHFQSKWDDFD